MTIQRFTQPEARAWSSTWVAPRQRPLSTAASTGHTAATTGRAEEKNSRAEPQKAEDWAGDCLFNCYND